MIPDYQTCMRPVLVLLADGQTWRKRDLVAALEEEFRLAPEERNALLPSGKQRVMASRAGWAITYLFKADLIERPARGSKRITDVGREALAAHPERIDIRTLESYSAFQEFRQRTDTSGGSPEQAAAESTAASTPADLIQQAIKANRAVVEAEVLAAAVNVSPVGFEQLVIQLLAAMGYGQRGSLERTPLSNDGGIDGIISQDPLGLDRIYVQAKCWALHRSVDRPEIQRFAGALLSKQGDRGVYITTAAFTRGARDEAERINARIELIDGQRLAQLLVHYGVGV